MKLLLLQTAILFSFISIGCGPSKGLPPNAKSVLKNAESFELLSLDPTFLAPEEKAGIESFHEWELLGKATISDSETRQQLLSAFNSGVAEHDDETMILCFDPRHAIRVIHDGKTHDFIICFSCERVNWRIDGEYAEGFGVASSPFEVFNKALVEAGLPLSER